MFTQKTLRNIPKKEFHTILHKYEYKNIPVITRGETRYDYSRFVDFLDKEFNENPLFKDDFDELVKENLYFNQMNQHYVYELISFFDTTDRIQLDEIIDILNKKEFNLNKDILEYNCSTTYDICNTSYDTELIGGIHYLSHLRFIIFVDTLENKEKDFNLFCTIDIDFNERFVSFKFNTLVFDNSDDPHEIISNIHNMFYDKNSPLSKLKIGKSSHNLSTVRKMIQKIFIKLSQQAENIIKKNLPKNIDDTINDFIKNLGIEYRKEYRDQIISVVYQDIGRYFTINDFDEGWVFRFLFNEGDNVRASSRSSNNLDHIYSTQIYWNLKELMFDEKGTEFLEAGFLWNVKSSVNGTEGAVSVRIEQNNDDIKLNYYDKPHNSIDRKEKEKVVLQNIRKGLSTR